MTIYTFIVLAIVFSAWGLSDLRERRRRDQWWRSWHQEFRVRATQPGASASAWHVVPELYDWESDGL